MKPFSNFFTCFFTCLCVTLFAGGGVAAAQQSATVVGVIEAAEPLPEGVRVGVHLVDQDGVWGREIAAATPEEGAFQVTLSGSAEGLRPFRSSEVMLPGLQSDFRVLPEGISYVRAQINVYIDHNDNGTFDRNTDTPYLGLAGVTDPTGFFVPLYVDSGASLETAAGVLELEAGWNIFTVRFPEGTDPEFAVSDSLENARLDVFEGSAP